jgi:3-methyladenine DNA glycosylase AlkD
MPPKSKTAPHQPTGREAKLSLQDDVEAALGWLERKSTKRDRDNMTRFAISTDRFFGVSMSNMKVLAKRLGRNHELAAALWDTGW